MLPHFEDREAVDSSTPPTTLKSLITRNKDWHDGSLVSGNASATMALLRLSRLVNRDDYREAAERTLLAAGDMLVKQSAACGALLVGAGSILDTITSRSCWRSRTSHTMATFRPRFLRVVSTSRDVVVGHRRCARQAGPVVALNE